MKTAGSNAGLSRRRFTGLTLGAAGLFALPGLAACARLPTSGASPVDGLPRSRPETHGVDPQAILAFLDEVRGAGLELHSFMLSRGGDVIGEGWWAPYRADRPHMMHSLTKSVAVSGVAIAMDEGLFGIDDKVISFFPDELPETVSDNLAAMTVRDLLTMRTGHAEEISGSVWRQIRTSWVAEFFKVPVVHRPGTRFVYSSAASFMLSAIVTKVTGQTLRDYMEPRFFKPLGIAGLSWDVGPGGINPGGNGLTWKTADALKLGMLYAQKGRWNGQQILSPEWVEGVSKPQVAEGEYSYQWWIGANNTYYAVGLFTQMAIVFPDHDAVLAVTGAIRKSELLTPIVDRHFPAAFGAIGLPPNDKSSAALAERTQSLSLLPALPATMSPVAARISGRRFKAAENAEDIESFGFTFAGDRCRFTMRDARGEHSVDVGLGRWIEDHTSMTGNKLHHQYQPDSMLVVAGGRWIAPDTFEMIWQFAETAFRDTVVCRFEGDAMTFDRSVNVNSAALSLPTVHSTLV
ncbi:serine hydrolase domain-containing protein [Sphingosinicella microcystinivorans]|uniref:serine hydrolase domain-containing protein n=1 Tax=Sphingosinicella microcystinivorans TaxID=335406 RepID=UPI0022F4016F|nr:serine hydrolase [Sphingosinicella microcystinivorans]WBX85115.1 serine hydrolase [Sphingosinicella microcystinivorans]